MEIKNPDFMSGIFWGILGFLFSIWSVNYPLWSLNQPGPGLFPLILGLHLIFFSLLLLLRQVKKFIPNKQKSPPFSIPRGWKKVAYTFLILLLATFLFERIGYLLTFFLLMISLMLKEKLQGWRVILLVALFSALGVYFVFVLLLKQDLPQGFLGI